MFRFARYDVPVPTSPALLLLLVGCTTTPEAEDPALFLGAGVITEDVADLFHVANWYADMPSSTMIGEGEHAWTGEVDLNWETPIDTETCALLAAPCIAVSVTVTLDDVVVHHGGSATMWDDFDCQLAGVDDDDDALRCDSSEGFDLDPPAFHLDGSFVLDLELHPPNDTDRYGLVAVTHAPALLSASGVWIDGAAMVTLHLAKGGNEFTGAVRVTGTVDGASYSYDYGWSD